VRLGAPFGNTVTLIQSRCGKQAFPTLSQPAQRQRKKNSGTTSSPFKEPQEPPTGLGPLSSELPEIELHIPAQVLLKIAAHLSKHA
jgi:hypothetical protein